MGALVEQRVLIDGAWVTSRGSETFASTDPKTGGVLGRYPVSPWSELDRALDAGSVAYALASGADEERFAVFLERFADRLEAAAENILDTAHGETRLPVRPRLADQEMPRTTDQLRQAAHAVRARSWKRPTLSPQARIGSLRVPLPGSVCTFGPNNFPLAFNAVSGGDFAAAVATGHPVIAKANPGHPATTALLAAEARRAVEEARLPPAFVQMIYHTDDADGRRMVADPRVAAIAYTGSLTAGVTLKEAADRAGKPVYLEMSSVNPVVVSPGALAERATAVADELAQSMLSASGQLCTSPGLIFVLEGQGAAVLRRELRHRLERQPGGPLLAANVQSGLEASRARWLGAGARVVAEGMAAPARCAFPNTMLEVAGSTFLADPATFQEEAFGNLSLYVVAADMDELCLALARLRGNLAGSIYTASAGDGQFYGAVEPVLAQRVGRLLNDKPPTGVAVVAAMHHGGPYPSAGHPGFTAVGSPASLDRFTMLRSYDNVSDNRLPDELKAGNPLGLQRYVDGEWTRRPVRWG
ncbi:MAG: aldehyde dehydrogenase family protein [Nitriliruptorales bacterium]